MVRHLPRRRGRRADTAQRDHDDQDPARSELRAHPLRSGTRKCRGTAVGIAQAALSTAHRALADWCCLVRILSDGGSHGTVVYVLCYHEFMVFVTAVQDALAGFQLHKRGRARPNRQRMPLLLARTKELFDHPDWTCETKWCRKTGAA
jgi:hypothetical protein